MTDEPLKSKTLSAWCERQAPVQLTVHWTIEVNDCIVVYDNIWNGGDGENIVTETNVAVYIVRDGILVELQPVWS